jgi:hypothetical protein
MPIEDPNKRKPGQPYTMGDLARDTIDKNRKYFGKPNPPQPAPAPPRVPNAPLNSSARGIDDPTRNLRSGNTVQNLTGYPSKTATHETTEAWKPQPAAQKEVPRPVQVARQAVGAGGQRGAGKVARETFGKDTDWSARQRELSAGYTPEQVETEIGKWRAENEEYAKANPIDPRSLGDKTQSTRFDPNDKGYRPMTIDTPQQTPEQAAYARKNMEQFLRDDWASKQIAKERGYGEQESMGQTRYFNPNMEGQYFATKEEAKRGMAFDTANADMALQSEAAKIQALKDGTEIDRGRLALAQRAASMQRREPYKHNWMDQPETGGSTPIKMGENDSIVFMNQDGSFNQARPRGWEQDMAELEALMQMGDGRKVAEKQRRMRTRYGKYFDETYGE